MQTRNADGQRDEQAEEDGLHAGNGRIVGVLLADAARDHRGGRHGKADADGKDQRQQGLGEPDRGHGIGPEAADPENVDDGEKRFEHHLQDHGNGQQKDGAVEVACGVVLVRAAERFTNRGP